MKLYCAVILTAIIGALLPVASASQPVEGTVVDSVTGAGVPNATVTLERGGRILHRATCSPLGFWRIEGVEAGDYRSTFSAPGYVAPEMNTRVTRSFHIDATVVTSVVKLDAKLMPAATLSGRVTDPDEKPVGGSEVNLTVSGSFVSQSMTTGPDGMFRFNNVSPGSYLLDAQPPADRKPPPPRAGEDFGWVRTYYPNGSGPDLAVKIEVNAGWQMTGQDIHLHPVPVHHIRGIVTDEKGEPVPRAPVKLILDSDIHAKAIQNPAKEDGSFEFKGVHDGGWQLSSSSEVSGLKVKGSRWIRVAGHDIDRLDLHLTPPFTVQGTVEVPGDSDHPGGCVMLAPEEGGSGDDIPKPGCDGARNFSFADVYRRSYRIEPIVFPADTYYLASITMGGRDVLGQVVELQPGSLPVHIVYKETGGTLRGTVADCADATVVVVPQEAALRKSVYYRMIRRAACTDGGNFQILNLRPGHYYAYAFDHDRQQLHEFAEMDQSLVNRAVSVNIRDGETETIALRVTAH